MIGHDGVIQKDEVAKPPLNLIAILRLALWLMFVSPQTRLSSRINFHPNLFITVHHFDLKCKNLRLYFEEELGTIGNYFDFLRGLVLIPIIFLFYDRRTFVS